MLLMCILSLVHGLILAGHVLVAVRDGFGATLLSVRVWSGILPGIFVCVCVRNVGGARFL